MHASTCSVQPEPSPTPPLVASSTTRTLPATSITQTVADGAGCCSWDFAVGCQDQNNPYCQIRENCEGSCSGTWMLTAVSTTLSTTNLPSSTILATDSWMIDASVPGGHRCSGKPPSGWGSLGFGLSPKTCQDACLLDPLCNFAVYKEKKGVCTGFGLCNRFKKQGGFTVWKKVLPTSSTTSTTSEPEPEPTTTTPEADCDLEAQMKTCISQAGTFKCTLCTRRPTQEPCCSCQGAARRLRGFSTSSQ